MPRTRPQDRPPAKLPLAIYRQRDQSGLDLDLRDHTVPPSRDLGSVRPSKSEDIFGVEQSQVVPRSVVLMGDTHRS